MTMFYSLAVLAFGTIRPLNTCPPITPNQAMDISIKKLLLFR